MNIKGNNIVVYIALLMLMSCVASKSPHLIWHKAEFIGNDEAKFKSFKKVKGPKQWAFVQKKKSQLDTIPLEWNRSADTVICIDFTNYNGIILTSSTFYSCNDSLTVREKVRKDRLERIYSREPETFDEEEFTPLYSAIRAWDMDSVNTVLKKSAFLGYDVHYMRFSRMILRNDSIISMEIYSSRFPMWITRPY